LDSILSLQPKTITSGSGKTTAEEVYELIPTLLEMLPLPIEMEDINKQLAITSEPLTVILKQESDRYNNLLNVVQRQLISLKRGIEGLELISEELELVMYAVFENKVPKSWGFCYHSIKPLKSWIDDFYKRVQ